MGAVPVPRHLCADPERKASGFERPERKRRVSLNNPKMSKPGDFSSKQGAIGPNLYGEGEGKGARKFPFSHLRSRFLTMLPALFILPLQLPYATVFSTHAAVSRS